VKNLKSDEGRQFLFPQQGDKQATFASACYQSGNAPKPVVATTAMTEGRARTAYASDTVRRLSYTLAWEKLAGV
jgi:hypothetical protein